MALFPITGRFVGDFVPHLVPVDTDDTMDEIAGKVASFSVGHRVARRPGDPGYEVLLGGELLPATTTLAAVMAGQEILPLQWFDVRFRETADA
ncbi:MAG: toluene-4-monooxygenase system B family protein [Streptosporangiaceae bacterium]|jgi:toluene monooxygenase system protein B